VTSPARRRELLAIARDSIAGALRREPIAPIAERPHPDEPTHGVFVTLKSRGELRGCIGTLAAEEGIARTVARFAREAAFGDPRFPPLSAEEWPAVTIEISIMTPPRRILPDEVVAGRHGLILEAAGRRGLLLPQVATEWNFDREQFLEALAQKAGLPPGAWARPESRLYAFEAEVFGEDPVPDGA
jgi:AmmeMemoRadiSam system protein A